MNNKHEYTSGKKYFDPNNISCQALPLTVILPNHQASFQNSTMQFKRQTQFFTELISNNLKFYRISKQIRNHKMILPFKKHWKNQSTILQDIEHKTIQFLISYHITKVHIPNQTHMLLQPFNSSNQNTISKYHS